MGQSMITSVKWAPLFSRALISACAGLLFFHYCVNFKSSQLLNVAGVLAGVSGTLLGFLITAVALLTAVMDRPLVANMRKTGHYQRLVSETFATCIGLFATTVLCIVALFFTDLALTVVFAVVVFMAVLSFLYVVEAGRRFSTIISALS